MYVDVDNYYELYYYSILIIMHFCCVSCIGLLALLYHKYYSFMHLHFIVWRTQLLGGAGSCKNYVGGAWPGVLCS